MKLIDGLAGESPASAGYRVGTVGISGDGAGDQPVGSPDVKVLDGWTQVWSAPTGGHQSTGKPSSDASAFEAVPEKTRRTEF